MRVTVAICTWNRSDLLRQTLDELTRASVPVGMELEVIVVNNNCTDATDAVIEEFRGRLPLIRVFESQPGLSHARNAALSAAAGDYIVFTDDDVLVDEAWLVEFKAATRRFPHASAIGGIIEPWFPQPPDPDLLEAFSSLKNGFCGVNHGPSDCLLSDNQFIYGANMGYLTAAIRPLRFDPAFGPTPKRTRGGDEVDLILRLRAAGGHVAWWPKMLVRHYVDPARMTLKYLLKFMSEKGSERIALAAPTHTDPMRFGAPRWLWRWFIGAYLRYLMSFVLATDVPPYPQSFTGSTSARASQRARRLGWRREFLYVGGMIRGYRQLERERARRGPEVASPIARSV